MFLTIIENSRSDLIAVYNFCTGKLGPEYRALELGVGDGLMIKVVSRCTGRSAAQIRESLQQIGDLGEVTVKSLKGQMKMDSFFTKKVQASTR